ncbi:hypothetical protein HCCG_01314 [Helicobacter cinaedi CCUG 18818 = ATCC BAA-847]|uniref:50 kDa outer membrane protein n=1 Tax=Helicobacter cinaedi CCUG 18818 = ATCC BAA-847 TaxID=537971 RepID=A0ABN0BB14_9HELI|nr:DUF3373 family protein [Helicobacter cinaedi]EFR46767.1 hypothetical protein HCCG_01314 [Helicobacter cinaedi CCUG 18818 = ATCC BAA-847]
MLRHKLIATLGGGLLLLSSSTLAATLDSLQKDIDELNDRVDANELAATLNKVKFGLEFTTALNNIQSKAEGTTENYKNRWAMGLYLNMNADVNRYTKFTGRLSMTKAFGDIDLGYPAVGTIGSLDAGRGIAGGSAIYVERAYVDIYMGKYTALTIGRLPGTDGPGSNLRNSSARMSTYPALAVNALGDGAVLTLKPYTNAALRAGYSKIYQPLNPNSSSAGGNIWGNKGASDANLFFGAFETPFAPKSFGQNLLMLTYINLQNYATPYMSNMSMGNNQTTSQTALPAQNIGDMQYVNLHIENDKMLGTGLNWFVSASYYKGSNGKSSKLAETIAKAQNTQNTQNADTPYVKFANENAWAVHAGLRYDIGSAFKIGYEYFKGSQYWYAFSRVSINDPFNFRNTRGDVHDVYAIWQLDLNQFFRLSYTRQHFDYNTAAMPTPTPKADITNQNIALAYLLRF